MAKPIRLKTYERLRYRMTRPDPLFSDELRQKVKAAPEGPGCYIFTDKPGNIIYVGKAKNLRHRVSSYFTKAALLDDRTSELMVRVADVSCTVTPSELDALLTEYRLIKQHKPWYNSQMKPDSPRPYLRVAAGVPYPTLAAVDVPLDDDAEYFDCFSDSYDIKRTLDLLSACWGVARCGIRSFNRTKTPCTYHSLIGCQSPCSGKADQEAYAASVQQVARLLSGKPVRRARELKAEVAQASEALDFERAQRLNNLLEGLDYLRRKSRRRFHLPATGMSLVLARPYREKAFSAFLAVDGRVRARLDLPAKPDDSLLEGLQAWFDSVATAPSSPWPDGEWLASALTEVSADKQVIDLPRGQAVDAAFKAIRRFVKK